MLQSVLSAAKSTVWPSASQEEYIFPKADPNTDGTDCIQDCADCTIRYPHSFKIDTSRRIYGSVKAFGTHVLVATGQSDWVPKVEHDKGSLMEAFKKTSCKSNQGELGLDLCVRRIQRVMVSASNISPQQDGKSDTSNDATTVLVLPAFLYVDQMTTADIPEFIERYVDSQQEPEHTTPPPNPNRRLVSRPCVHDYIVLLCSHRSRDARCGISAPLIKAELERHLRRQNLLRDQDDTRPGGVSIFFVSHLSGHKVSANVLVYRREAKQMIWLARIRPEHCEGIVKHTILEGKVVCPEDRLRGGVDWKEDVMSW